MYLRAVCNASKYAFIAYHGKELREVLRTLAEFSFPVNQSHYTILLSCFDEIVVNAERMVIFT